MTPEDSVRAFYAVYSDGQPERFDEVVSADYVDYGHTPPGHGPQGARDDYEHAIKLTGGVTTYDVDALVTRDDTVAVAWTGHMANGADVHGLGLYKVADGLVSEARNALIGPLPF